MLRKVCSTAGGNMKALKLGETNIVYMCKYSQGLISVGTTALQ